MTTPFIEGGIDGICKETKPAAHCQVSDAEAEAAIVQTREITK